MVVASCRSHEHALSSNHVGVALASVLFKVRCLETYAEADASVSKDHKSLQCTFIGGFTFMFFHGYWEYCLTW